MQIVSFYVDLLFPGDTHQLCLQDVFSNENPNICIFYCITMFDSVRITSQAISLRIERKAFKRDQSTS